MEATTTTYQTIDEQALSEGWAELVEAEKAAYQARQAELGKMTDDEWQDWLTAQNEEAGARYDFADGGRF